MSNIFLVIIERALLFSHSVFSLVYWKWTLIKLRYCEKTTNLEKFPTFSLHRIFGLYWEFLTVIKFCYIDLTYKTHHKQNKHSSDNPLSTIKHFRRIEKSQSQKTRSSIYVSKAITTCQENKYLSSKGIGSSGLVYNRNHYFGLGPIPKPKPKLADTFGRNRNWYRNPISKGESVNQY